MAAASKGASRQGHLWPTGHSGWFFSGLTEYEGWVASFLAEGASRGERLMYVADDPRPSAWPRALVERGDLLIASTSETYGDDRVVDPASQRATFEAALDEALRQGYAGLRVAADNTSLVAGPDRLAAWVRWEGDADRFMSEHPMTAMCAFDRTRVETDALAAVMGIHDVTYHPLW